MAKITIDAPVREPERGGLLSVANVVDSIPAGAAYHGIRYQADPCGKNRVVPTDNSDKIFDQTVLVQSEQFSLYRGVEDALLLGADAQDRATRLYRASESYGVEAKIQELLFNPVAVDLTPTPGTPVTNPKLALGLLEQYAADNYSYLPMIHGNRLAVSLIPDMKAEADGKLFTVHMTPIVNGGGYGPDGTGAVTAGEGEAWLYATGNLTIWRGSEVGPPTGVDDLKGNRSLGLMERQYVATVECFVAAVLVGTA
jgi:hypothetical protein